MSARREVSVFLDGIEPRPALLAECRLARSLVSKKDQKKDAQRYYEARITDLEVDEKYVLATCEFSAGERFAKSLSTEVTATYVVGFLKHKKISVSREKEVIEYLVKDSAWSRFMDLFSSILGQTSLTLPPLLIRPEIEWAEGKRKRSKVER